MNRRFCPSPFFSLLVFIIIGFHTTHAWGETEDASNQMPMEPDSCVEMIEELQNMLHAAHQTNELLASENRELQETINRIRRDLNGEVYHGVEPALENKTQ